VHEQEIIERFFRAGPARHDVRVGIGDDAAVLVPPAGHELIVTTDTLVCGRHFLADAPAGSVGHKSLAANLSDLAAMGAEPAHACLALTIPGPDAAWLQGFADGFFALAARHEVALIGGNLARGPLSITVQAMGYAPQGAALLRGGARPGDRIFVTGALGDAALGLACLQGRRELSSEILTHCIGRLQEPTPRVEAGVALRGIASAALDISDGLAQDLGRLLSASGAGATVAVERLPLSPQFRQAMAGPDDYRFALAGGDDYELLFTADRGRLPEIARLGDRCGGITQIGHIETEPGLRLELDGARFPLDRSGYDHFSE
jgi:thiamine-monophosphate kinase